MNLRDRAGGLCAMAALKLAPEPAGRVGAGRQGLDPLRVGLRHAAAKRVDQFGKACRFPALARQIHSRRGGSMRRGLKEDDLRGCQP